jgi:hypothetical protein
MAYLNGGDWHVEEHTEVERGRNSNRPALKKAFRVRAALQAAKARDEVLDDPVSTWIFKR